MIDVEIWWVKYQPNSQSLHSDGIVGVFSEKTVLDVIYLLAINFTLCKRHFQAEWKKQISHGQY